MAPARRPRRLPRLGWLLIPLAALLLGGVVWVNVARLQLTTQTSTTVERYRGVQAEIVQLRARLAQRDGDVIEQARRRLGMVQAPSKDVTYLTVRPDTAP
ncbi:MAG: hypothetical protein MUE51_12415 [Thermoleophilia bacterium]|nr:hypothetical protein [Thermoleophilia bacterium]